MAERLIVAKRPRTPVAAYSVVGLEGRGKTRFLLTAPKPLTLVTIDPNSQYVIDAMAKEGALDADQVTVHQFRMPSLAFEEDRDDIKDEAMEAWKAIANVLRPIVQQEVDPRPRAVALDTGTDLYHLRVLGQFGKLDQISPEARRNMMGIPNRAYSGLVESLLSVGVNVLIAHRGKNAWADKVIRTQRGEEDTRVMLTGPFDVERDGFKGTGFITSVETVLAFEAERESKTLAGKFGMKVVRCGHRPILIGQEWWGREKQADGTRVVKASFPYLASQIWPDLGLEAWT